MIILCGYTTSAHQYFIDQGKTNMFHWNIRLEKCLFKGGIRTISATFNQSIQ